MTAPGGIAYDITADASGLDEELRRAVMDAMRDVQRELDSNPLAVGFDVDGDELWREIDRELREIERVHDPRVTVRGEFDSSDLLTEIDTALAGGNRTIRIDADIDVDTARLAAIQSIGTLTDTDIRLRLDIDVDAAQLAAVTAATRISDTTARVRLDIDVPQAEAERLRAIGPALRSIRNLTDRNIRIGLRLDMSQAELARLQSVAPALRSLRGLTDRDVTIRVRLQADEAQLRRVADLVREIRSHTANITINTNADDAADRVDRLRGSLGGLGIGTGAIAGITAGLAGIVGAAGAAAGALGGVVAAAVALGPALGAVIGTATVAMQGVGDAFSAMSAMSENGATEAAAHADKVAAAADAVESAQVSAQSAASAYADAQQDAIDANRTLAESYELAAEDAEDLAFKQRGASISVKEALFDLEDAQKRVNEATDPRARARALAALESAQLRYDKALDASADVNKEVNEAEAAGIEGSDRVVAAREAKEQADRRATEAGQQLARANDAVAAAAANLAKVQAEGTPSAQKFAQALAELSPATRDMVLAAQAAKPAWDDFQNAVQESFFTDSAAAVTNLANVALPVLEDGMVGVADQMNRAGLSFANFLTSAQGLEGLRTLFAGTENLLAGMQSGAGGFATGLIDAMQVAEGELFGIGQAIADVFANIGGALTAAADSGVLAGAMDGFRLVLEAVGPLLGDLVFSLLQMAQEVLPALAPLLSTLGDTIVALAPGLGELGRVFAESLTAVMPSLTLFLTTLVDGLQPVLPVLANLLSAMFGALTPLVGPFSEIAVIVGNALVEAIVALTPALGPVAEAFAALLSAAAPLVPLIAETAAVVLQALAPALTEVFTALAPVIASLAEQMRPVLAEIAPILAETAMILGQALADALIQITPYIPQLVRSFSELLLAVLPILPELARMAAELLPSLMNVLIAVVPQVTGFMDALRWLVESVILPIVLPNVQLMVDNIRTGMDVIAAAITWVRDTAGVVLEETGGFFSGLGDRISQVQTWITETVFPALGRGLDTVKGWFESGVDGIARAWDGLRDAAATPVRFVVNTAWNEGLLKAWNSVAEFLPGIEAMQPVTLGFRSGGAVFGPGTGTSDSVPAWLSTGEHIVTAAEVIKAGGQNIWYAIRDMIARGVPFTWDGGRLIQDLGRANLDAYGAAVRTRGIGNVSPEGLFDQLMPRFRTGGAVLPWMYQLKAGHDFARAQDGRPYQWAGPRWVGDSFDCSGYIGSIIAAILGGNPWQRYWATSSFAGYPQVGAQGLVKNLREGVGMLVGITDDPGGPGGGHTSGELRGIPELGIPAARVESGGALGDVHYGRGTPVTSFASLYGLPIGANGFFQPSLGGGSVGPSPDSQRSFVQSQIDRVFREITDPLRAEMAARIGPPPPQWNRIPPEFLTTVSDKAATHLGSLVTGLGELLPSAWTKAQELAGRAFEALTPFDSGGLARGVGFMPKNTIAPERVLSPEQTRLFESLVVSLQQIAGAGSAAAGAPELLTVQAFEQGITNLAGAITAPGEPGVAEEVVREVSASMDTQRAAIDAQGLVLADTRDLIQRTSSSQEQVAFTIAEQQNAVLNDIVTALGFDVLAPIVQAGMDAALEVVRSWLKAGFGQVVAGTDRTTAAVENQQTGSSAPPAPFGAPGSAFDAAQAISDAVVSVANTARQTFEAVAQQVADAALAQKPSRVGNSKGVLGRDITGGPVVDMIVRLTGVEIEIRDMLQDTLEEIRGFKGDLGQAFDASGRIVQDTAELMQRNESSRDIVIEEQNRINRELIKAVLRYLISAVLIPILTAILGAMITLVSTAIGAAIGASIPVIGPLIGAALGAVIGAALGGLASVFTGLIAVGAGAAIDSFDEGGVAHGIGLLPKNTLKPERVLSPRQTESFDRLVAAIEGGQFGRREVNAPITVLSGGPGTGRQVSDHLLSLM